MRWVVGGFLILIGVALYFQHWLAHERLTRLQALRLLGIR